MKARNKVDQKVALMVELMVVSLVNETVVNLAAYLVTTKGATMVV